jgi:hypothetical protein
MEIVMPKGKLTPEGEVISAYGAAMVAAFQVLINCLEESDALLPGQFPDALGVYKEKEPFAVIELRAETERSLKDGTSSGGPSVSVEFPVIKDWLEIETGISPLFRQGQAEWQADLLFKKPFTINEHVEFMIGVGPQLSYTTPGGGTQIASEFALEWMFWPTKDRKFGWFVEPTYSYSFNRGHKQSVGVTTGLTIAIP